MQVNARTCVPGSHVSPVPDTLQSDLDTRRYEQLLNVNALVLPGSCARLFVDDDADARGRRYCHLPCPTVVSECLLCDTVATAYE